MKRKYLDDLGVKDRWDTWKYDKETKKAHKEYRDTYGVDPKETFSLDQTFFMWLYERLKAYICFAEPVVDLKTDVITYEWEGKQWTQYDLIIVAIAYLEEYLVFQTEPFTHTKEYIKKNNLPELEGEAFYNFANNLEIERLTNARKAAEMFITMLPSMWW